jgi:SAM-dependent methyltransferase
MEKSLTLYEGINEIVLSFVPPSADRILDIGCGTGALGERLRHDRERCVIGITYSQQEADRASRRLSQVICAELNTFDFCSLGEFDCVILSHILEHLYSPEKLLERLKSALGPESVIVVALPNVVWWRQRLQFLFGRWRYQDWGILDRTHFRFFDLHSADELIQSAGYEILKVSRDGPLPFTKPVRKLIGPLAKGIERFVCSVSPGLFACQFVYLARLKT